jgi:hypothetical protein
MDNKTILELIKKNLEEINLLVDDLYKGGDYNQLLIEITSAKTNILHQELKLLTPTESSASISNYFELVAEPIVHDDFHDVPSPIVEIEPESVSALVDELPVVEPIAAEVEEPEVESEPAFEQSEAESLAIEEDSPQIEESPLSEEPNIVEPVQENTLEEVTAPVLEEPKTDEIIIDEVEAELLNVEEVTEEIPPVAEEIIQNEEVLDVEPTEILAPERADKKVFGEQFSKEPSLHDKLSGSTAISSRIKGLPISNLRSAIGLNDRFLYTRELFENDSSKFDLTVDTIDQLSSFLEAIEYLEKNFKWTKNENSLKFMDLVKRRFEK